jgi:hypothetical protein
MDNVTDFTVMKIKQWIQKTESNGDWLLSRPRLTQGCSAERKEGILNQSIISALTAE